MINADDSGRPAALYRRLGFTDEVYWYQSYSLASRGTPAEAELCWGDMGIRARTAS